MSGNIHNKKKKFFKDLLINKFRLVIIDEYNFQERFSLKLNHFNVFIFIGLFSTVLVLFTLFLIVFTPLNSYIPRHENTNIQTQNLLLKYKLDSIENQLRFIILKNNAILPILRGDSLATEFNFKENIDGLNQEIDTSINLSASLLDSILREEVDRNDRFSLFESKEKKEEVTFFSPITGIVTDAFSIKDKHFGVDISVAIDTPVKAVSDGTVIFAEWTANTGNVIIVEHLNGYTSIYKHNASLIKNQGDIVESGEVIAIAGSSGELSTGLHLHFELWYDGYPIDPTNFIDFE